MIGIMVSVLVFAFLLWLIMRGDENGSGSDGGGSVWQNRLSGAGAKRSGVGHIPEVPNRRNQARAALKQLREKEKLKSRSTGFVSAISEMIVCAGYSFSPRFFLVGMGVFGALIFCILVMSVGLSVLPSFVIGAMAGFFGPRWWLRSMIARRRKKFLVQFSDALDMIVRGAKSGLPVVECLRAVAQETQDPLSSEFQMVVDRMALGAELKSCMNLLYQRMPIPEVSFFSVVLVIQSQTGGNLSEALSNLSSVIRARALMKEKVKALTSESKASSFVLISLPFIIATMMYTTNKDYISPLFETSFGNNLLLVAGGLMAIGIFTMNKLSSIKI